MTSFLKYPLMAVAMFFNLSSVKRYNKNLLHFIIKNTKRQHIIVAFVLFVLGDYFLSPIKRNSIKNKLIKSKYNSKAPLMAFV